MRKRNSVLTEEKRRYLAEQHRRKVMLEKRIDMIVNEEINEALGKNARNWLLGGAAAAGLALAGNGQSEADMYNMDHLLTMKQNIEMEYGRPISQIPPSQIADFYKECEKLGVNPDNVK